MVAGTEKRANFAVLYKQTSDLTERKRLQTEAIIACRPRVAGYVRRHFPSRHWDEAKQVGAIGVLVALEKFDASRGIPFWFFAVQWVRKELQTWVSHGVRWRPGTNGAKGRRENLGHAYPASMDSTHYAALAKDQMGGLFGGKDGTLHNILACDVDVEEIVSTAEGLAKVEEFLKTLSAEERHLLLCEKRKRGDGHSDRARRYQSLIGRAIAFVKGADDGGVVRRDPGTRGADGPVAARIGARGDRGRTFRAG